MHRRSETQRLRQAPRGPSGRLPRTGSRLRLSDTGDSNI